MSNADVVLLALIVLVRNFVGFLVFDLRQHNSTRMHIDGGLIKVR